MIAYTPADVGKLTKIRYGTLIAWINRGIIAPSVRVSSKSRENHLFSEDDIYRIGIFKVLRDIGFTTKGAKRVLERIESPMSVELVAGEKIMNFKYGDSNTKETYAEVKVNVDRIIRLIRDTVTQRGKGEHDATGREDKR